MNECLSLSARNEPSRVFYRLGVSVDTEEPEVVKKDEDRIYNLIRACQASSKSSRMRSRTEHMLIEELQSNPSFRTAGRGRQHFRNTNLARLTASVGYSGRQHFHNTNYNLARLTALVGYPGPCFPKILSRCMRDDVPYSRRVADRAALLSFGVTNMSMMALMETVHLLFIDRVVVNREQ